MSLHPGYFQRQLVVFKVPHPGYFASLSCFLNSASHVNNIVKPSIIYVSLHPGYFQRQLELCVTRATVCATCVIFFVKKIAHAIFLWHLSAIKRHIRALSLPFPCPILLFPAGDLSSLQRTDELSTARHHVAVPNAAKRQAARSMLQS